MLGIFRKAKKRQRKATTGKAVAVRYARGQYKIVDGNAERQVAPSSVETQGEDKILDAGRRGRLLNLTRNLVRNSSLFSTILLQLESNVVGTAGGKVVLNLPDAETSDRLRRLFAAWTRNADFFDGYDFNHLLKVFLRQQIVGGDLVIVFDHFAEGSGKLVYFEADEVVNVSPEVLARHYGKGARQSLGKVYSASGRWIGSVVSKSAARGVEYADEKSCWFLKRDPNGNPLDEFWIQPSSAWRKGSRGVSPAATAVNTATQLEDLVLSELEASRKNAQTFCWLQSDAEDEADVPSAFGNDADGDRVDVDGMTDAEVEKAVADAADEERRIVLKEAHENAVAFQQLPSGFRAQQLDTKHPNTNVETMTQYLSGRVAAVLGLSRAFATGNPTNDDFRAQQLLTAPAIVQYQKDLERICDWAFANFCRFAAKNGWLDAAALPDDLTGLVSWEWKRLDSCDEAATENANFLKLKNMTGSYCEILGNDWRKKLLQVADEVRWMREHGMTHPSALMLSGGETTAEKVNAPKKDTTENEDRQV